MVGNISLPSKVEFGNCNWQLTTDTCLIPKSGWQLTIAMTSARQWQWELMGTNLIRKWGWGFLQGGSWGSDHRFEEERWGGLIIFLLIIQNNSLSCISMFFTALTAIPRGPSRPVQSIRWCYIRLRRCSHYHYNNYLPTIWRWVVLAAVVNLHNDFMMMMTMRRMIMIVILDEKKEPCRPIMMIMTMN